MGFFEIRFGSLAATSAQATISASDPITISISGPSTVDEGDATTAYTVSLSPSGVTPTADLTVSYATADGTASSTTDYTAASGTLTFTSTASGAQTFTVDTTEDTIDEGTGETFSVSISSPSGGGGMTSLGTSSVSTTITDDDDAPTGITLSASPDSLGEDDAATSVTVTATLNGGTTSSTATVVTIGALKGSATKDADYAATNLTSITIPANATSASQSFTVTPTDDTVVEGDETIIIPGSTTTEVGLTVTSASITLTDDNKSTPIPDNPDDKDSAEISISGPSGNVAEGSDATFIVTLSKAVAAQVQVGWSAPLAADSAVAADLSATSGTVTFAANSAAGAMQTVTFTVTDDALSETAERFTVTLGAITSTLSSQISKKNGASSATATIAESDPITVNISGPSSVDEGDTTSNYTVSLSPSGVSPTADLTVSYATSNGTASSTTDYTAASGTLTFTSTASGAQTFTVDTTEDTIDEGTGETFSVSISSPSGGGGMTSLGTSSVSTTITDDDDAPTGITLSASPDTLGEDDSATSITVTAMLNGGTTRPTATVVTISTLSGTATKGTDYGATTLASVTIPANTSTGTGTLTITPTDDEVVEGDETIIIPGTTTVTGLSVTSATITLTDDDKDTTTPGDKDEAELSISGPGSNVAEGSDATFTVTLSKVVDAQVQVAWSAPLAADVAEGSDLSATSGTVTFAANSAAGATQTVTITATDDSLSEEAEGFTVTLGTITSTLSSQVSLKNGAKSAAATIAESDPITVSISGPTTVDEGDTTTAYTVSLSPAGVTPTADLTVSYATADGTATAGSDYTSKSGTLTFTSTAAGSQTFTVQTREDTIDEGTGETFTVSISSPAGGGGPAPSLATTKTVTTTITDDDDAPTGITLSANPSTLGEDDSATSITVTATLNGSTLPSDTVVTIGTLSGSATKGTDYTVTTLASITIPANTSTGTGTLTITPTDDSVVEGNETITIPGSTTTQVGLSVTSATVTLTDDDKTTTAPGDKDSAEISISGPASNVAEGSDATFTVTLSKAVAVQVQVGWSAPLGTDATESADLSATSGTVTFAANSSAGATQSITITATDDVLSETAESFTVTLGAITSTLSSQISLKSGAKSAQATIAESDPIKVSISGPSGEVTEGGAGTYTVSLSPSGVTPTSNLTVSYNTADGTAVAGSDYTAKRGTLTFTQTDAGDKTFTVQTIEDILAENSEDFTVTISSPSGGGGPTPSLGSSSSVTTTIRDNDALILSPSNPSNTDIQLTVSPDSVDENDGQTTFTVTATLDDDTPRTEGITIALSLGGTADSSDYTGPAAASVTIPAGQTSGNGTLTLTLIDDDISEGDETIIVGGKSGDLRIASAVITVTDDDSAYLSITGPSADVTEGTSASFTVTLSKTVTAAVTVAWSATAGTASASDYSSTSSGAVTFDANSAAGTTQTITVATINDMLSEGEETFSVALGADTGDEADKVWVKSTAASAEATIASSDAITINISGPSTVDEGDTTTAYTVSLSPSGVTPTADLTVSYATSNGTATAGSDYTAAIGTLTFTSTAAGSQAFTVQTIEDILSENSENFTVSISNPTGGGGTTSLGTSTSVTTTIDDDDVTNDPPENRQDLHELVDIWLTVDPDSVNEGAGSIDFTVTAKHNGDPQGDPVTIQLALAGTATLGSSGDYTAPAQASVTIAANQTSGEATLTLTILNDTETEGDETIIVGGSSGDLIIQSAVITIHDDEATYLSITGPTSDVAEGSSAIFTVTLSKAVAAEVTVAWNDAPRTAQTSDYTEESGTLTFAANSGAGATRTITIPVTDDGLSEMAETFDVVLGAVGGAGADDVFVKTTASSATATIAASDAITVSISGPSSADEGDATTNYSVSLSGGTPTEDLTVNYATSNGTALAGSDYTADSGTLTFTQANSGAQTFTVRITDDNLSESGETFSVNLSSATGGGGPAPSIGTSSVTTTIAASDAITVSISGPATVDEGDATSSYTVSVSGGTPTADLSVSYATSNGTALAGSDYTAASGMLTFSSGSTVAQTFTIQTTQDRLDESDETFAVTLSSATGGGGTTSLGTAKSVTTTITDDDDAPSDITLSITPTTFSEDADATDFIVTATLQGGTTRTSATVVTISLDGTATSSDYTVTTALASITIPAGEDSESGTLTLKPINDSIVEGDETIDVSGSTTVGLDVSPDQITLTDDSQSERVDRAVISISGPTSTVEEGGSAEFTVTLSKQVDAEVQVAWTALSSEDDTADDADLDETSGSVTFAASSAEGATQTITISIADDTLSEDAETFTVTLGDITSTLSDQISVDDSASSAQATIAESDPITVSISGPSEVDEGDATTAYTVSLSPSGVTPTADLTVSYGTADESAAAGSDYTAASGTLTFTSTAAGSQTITVDTTEDNIDEPNETFIVTISSPSGGGGPVPTLGTSSVTTTINDDDSGTPPETDPPPGGTPPPESEPEDPPETDPPPPTPTGITLSVSPTSVGENDGATSFTVTATLKGEGVLSSNTTVTISLGGTATENADYTVSTALSSITIPAKSTSGSGTLSIDPAQDEIEEGDETILVSGSTTVGLSVGSAEITLTDDTQVEQPDSAKLSISGPTGSIPEGGTASFIVTLSAEVDAAVTVAWSALLDTDSATAADLGSTSGSVSFAAGSAAGSTRTIAIPVTDDVLSETSETFTVSLGTITSALSSSEISLDASASRATATIAESDPITVHLTGPSAVDEGEATSAYTITLLPSGVIPTAELTVEYATSDGTAEAGSDFTAISGVLTFTQSDAGAKSLTVQTTDDALDEGSGETFSVSILNPEGGGGPAPILASTVVTTITDDDQAQDRPPSPPENDPVPTRPTPDTPSRPTPDQPTHTPTNTYTPGTWSSSTGGTSSPITAEASTKTTVEASTGMAGTSSTSTLEAPTTSTMETTSVPTPGDGATSASGNGVTSIPEGGVATTSGAESMPTPTSLDDAPVTSEDDVPSPPEAPGATAVEEENPLSWLSPFPWWILLLILALMIVLIIVTRRAIMRALGRGIRGA